MRKISVHEELEELSDAELRQLLKERGVKSVPRKKKEKFDMLHDALESERKEAIEEAFDKVLVNELMSRKIECEVESLISRLRSFHDERSKDKRRVRRSKRRKIENSSDSETVSLSEGEKSMADFRVSQFSKSQLSRMTARQARFEILFLEMLKEERKEIPLLEENHDPSDNQWCTVS